MATKESRAIKGSSLGIYHVISDDMMSVGRSHSGPRMHKKRRTKEQYCSNNVAHDTPKKLSSYNKSGYCHACEESFSAVFDHISSGNPYWDVQIYEVTVSGIEKLTGDRKAKVSRQPLADEVGHAFIFLAEREGYIRRDKKDMFSLTIYKPAHYSGHVERIPRILEKARPHFKNPPV